MYALCKLVMNEKNGTLLGHPMNVVFRSDDLEAVATDMMRRIMGGCPADTLLVYKEVEFNAKLDISFNAEDAK